MSNWFSNLERYFTASKSNISKNKEIKLWYMYRCCYIGRVLLIFYYWTCMHIYMNINDCISIYTIRLGKYSSSILQLVHCWGTCLTAKAVWGLWYSKLGPVILGPQSPCLDLHGSMLEAVDLTSNEQEMQGINLEK